jgi:hypothetical protein
VGGHSLVQKSPARHTQIRATHLYCEVCNFITLLL